jgi:hypothetical protein
MIIMLWERDFQPHLDMTDNGRDHSTKLEIRKLQRDVSMLRQLGMNQAITCSPIHLCRPAPNGWYGLSVPLLTMPNP